MELTLSIPALLFPAISLSMLAYNARYLAIAALIRELHRQYKAQATVTLEKQVRQLQRRLEIIKQMQAAAILSFLFSALWNALDFCWSNEIPTMENFWVPLESFHLTRNGGGFSVIIDWLR